jgi:hypothetical protein
MPTPDASAFTRQSKLRAYENQARTGNVKMITHLYQPIVTTTGLVDFLPSFTNKNVSPLSRAVKYTIPRLSGGTLPGGSGVAGNGSLNVTPVKPKYIQ